MAHGYTVVAVGPNRFRVARVFRPTWAVVLAVLTVALCGVGLLFLLVKHTETGDAVIAEDRAGVKLRLSGALRPQMVAAVRAAMMSWAPPATTVNAVRVETYTTFAPSALPSASSPSEGNGLSSVVEATVPRTPRAARVAELMLMFLDGTRIVVAGGVVIGRGPSADASMPSAALHAIPDPSLSKTHVSVGASPSGGVWVLDHHSTNGTSVLTDGAATRCAPGTRVEVPVGAQIVAGDLRMEVGSR